MIGFVQINGLDKRKRFPHQQKVKKLPSPDGDVTIDKYLDGVCYSTSYDVPLFELLKLEKHSLSIQF